MQIRYPARLYVEGKMVKDKFPDWYETLNMDRLGNTTTDLRNNTTDTRNRQDRKHYSVYSNDTVVDSTIPTADRRSHSENEEVFEVAENSEHSCEESDRGHAPMEVNKPHKTAAYEEKQHKIENKPCADQCSDSSATEGRNQSFSEVVRSTQNKINNDNKQLHKNTSTNKSKPEPRGNATMTKRETINRQGNPSDEVKRDYSLGSQQVDTEDTRRAEIPANQKRT
ncbi:hypothetical protein DPMN_168951 [Dreissena polymorpha]|uniref:Uncharacterized protein n=1 Tax=Dreissena polymorpha TaxID=45954 RepID=A0A9D4IZV4_DREPO|nr:hypothetical protein DPMN_168951 [Dreissena polymorpha]